MMIYFLEADWQFCLKRSKEEGVESEAALRDSLLWHYITGNTNSANRGARRRIVKAILATASFESLKDYPEIWDKETDGPPRKAKDDKQLGKVDFETGDMADYDGDEDMQDAPSGDSDEEPPSSDSDDDESIKNVHGATRQLGGMNAVDLRQRLIALVCASVRSVASSLIVHSSLKSPPTYQPSSQR